MLKKMHSDQFGVTQHEKDRRREQSRKKKGEQEKLVSEIKSLEEKFLEKQEKNKSKAEQVDEDTGPTELLQRPQDYFVKFRFPEPPPLQPPILGMYSE